MAPTDAESDLPRRIGLAHIRESLIAPARSILGYQEMLVEDAQRLGLPETVEDLLRVRTAGHALVELLDRLLDFEADAAAGSGPGLQAQLRHELRTPLNAVIGYTEMILEDLPSAAGEGLRCDLEHLLGEARQVLDLLESIVDFSRSVRATSKRAGPRFLGLEPADPQAAGTAMGVALQGAIRPVAAPAGTGLAGRILVVDDNENNRELLRRRLERDGHSVVTARSGRAALALLAQDLFDVVLLDLMMPDMNGLELLLLLRQDERWHRTPVIMISGLSDNEAVIRCIAAGADDYLPKPFDPVLLRARINAGIERGRWHERERDYLRRIEAEKERADRLLHSILPGQIVARLSGGETAIADRFEAVTVLFADLVGFTSVAAQTSPVQLVERLNRIFSGFDALVEQSGVEKIKTIGDAYMAAAGLPEPRTDHADVIVALAFRMLAELDRLERGSEQPFQVRIGIHTGPVIAGVIGRHRFLYDIWGDTVNVASRLETYGVARRVQVSEATRAALRAPYECEPRGRIDLRGVGRVSVFLLKEPAAVATPGTG